MQKPFLIVVNLEQYAAYVLAWVFPVYINIFKRDIVDDRRNTELNIDHAHTVNVKELELERNVSEAKQAHETIERTVS